MDSVNELFYGHIDMRCLEIAVILCFMATTIVMVINFFIEMYTQKRRDNKHE
jgi:hypothetical protein